ncbi:DUF4350 domain-containing protein [Nocardioides nanhaiensis]|uniref:DUF4350 domain-containing protein n=1 Tax=Nocardioides nanhaiensis TaxID=1476871 RepID=A0ABP8VZ43_9ACTN
MSLLAGSAPAPADPAPASAGAGPGSWRRHRAMLLVGLGFALAVALAVATNGPARTGEPLDPDNPGPEGTRAIARVLDDQGVEVQVVRGLEELGSTRLGSGDTLVVSSTDLLGEGVVARLREQAGPARVVLVEPTALAASLFGVRLQGESALPDGETEGWEAGCDLADLDGLRLDVDAATTYLDPGATSPPRGACFPADGAGGPGALLVERDGVVLLGAGQALTNDQVLRADNAAVALRLLGGGPRLVWFVPRLDDLGTQEAVGVGELLPPWIRPGLWVLALAALALLLWRARRLGPLATEPLPVVVKAVETTLSRGRLYRRAGDRAHAATALRTATRRRLTARLGLDRREATVTGTDPDALVRRIAEHTGRESDAVAALLGAGAAPPTTDRQLVQLATDLHTLEEEVRHP